MSKNLLEITGVLLTGGKSRRMGRNKALLKLDGKELIERNLETLNKVCSEVVISSNEDDLYKGYGYPVITDDIKGKGPLGGIYSVLKKAKNDHLFFAACDMPFLHEEAIRYIYREMNDFDAVVPYALGRIHPLHACYHKRILPLVEEKVLNDKLRLTDVLGECRTKIIKVEKCSDIYQKLIERSVQNVNTPDEWDIISKE